MIQHELATKLRALKYDLDEAEQELLRAIRKRAREALETVDDDRGCGTYADASDDVNNYMYKVEAIVLAIRETRGALAQYSSGSMSAAVQ